MKGNTYLDHIVFASKLCYFCIYNFFLLTLSTYCTVFLLESLQNRPVFLFFIPLQAKRKNPGLGQNANMTKRNLMAAILQTGGPVATTTAVTWGYKFLRMLTKAQFEAAAKDLQAMMLGTLVSSTNARGAPSLVFVKKNPVDAAPILLQNQDLCTPEFYVERFSLPCSKAIGKNTVDKLVAHGLVSADQMHNKKGNSQGGETNSNSAIPSTPAVPAVFLGSNPIPNRTPNRPTKIKDMV